MSDAAQLKPFLEDVVPWPANGEHYVNIHWTRWSEERQRTFFTGRAVKTPDEAVRAIRWAQSLSDTRNIYICMSAQSMAEVKTSKAGNQYLLPIRNQENAVSLKSLFIDIDVKEGEGYADQDDAVTALIHFLTSTGFPRPNAIVSSGNGIHAHWVLDRALPPAEWQPLANALAEATRQHDLKCDTQCTINSAQILRPPETQNFKSDPPKQTFLRGQLSRTPYPVGKIAEMLQPFMHVVREAKPVAEVSVLPKRDVVVENELGTGIESAPSLDIVRVAEECPWIKASLADGGVDNNNALRRQIYLLSSFTEDPKATAWELVKNRATLEPGEFDDQMERMLAEREEKDLGWPSCAAILNSGCSHCALCKHIAEGKSPANFSRPPAPVAPVSDLPDGYLRNAKGWPCMRRDDGMGGTGIYAVMDYAVFDPWLQRNPWRLTFDAIIHNDIREQVSIELDVTTSKESLAKALVAHGIALDTVQVKIAQDFILSWIKLLQQRKNAVVETSAFGWNVKDGKIEGFVYGGALWTPDGNRPAPNSDPVLQRQYTPVGDIQCWKDAATLVVGHDRPELEAIVASAFGAPLMQFTGWEGALMAAYSQESGIGKTTALKIAQAVYGSAKAMQGLDDTQNAVLHKIGLIRSLPLYWDEIKTDEDTRKFVKLAFSMTRGAERARLGRDIQLRETGSWSTLLVSATNESLIDHIASQTSSTTAGLYRLFEFDVAPPKTQSSVGVGVAQRRLAALNNNYGQVGVEYAKWLGENFETVEQEVSDYLEDLSKRAHVRNDERFWLATITCVVMGARFATRLGFADFDEPELEAFMLRALRKMRQHLSNTHVDLTRADNLVSVMTQFLKAMHRNTIKTNKINTGQGKPKKDSIKILNDLTRVDGIHVQIGVEDKIIRFSSQQFTDWATDRGVSRHILMDNLKSKFGARRMLGRLGSGTSRAGGSEWLIEIQAAGTALESSIDDKDEE